MMVEVRSYSRFGPMALILLTAFLAMALSAPMVAGEDMYAPEGPSHGSGLETAAEAPQVPTETSSDAPAVVGGDPDASTDPQDPDEPTDPEPSSGSDDIASPVETLPPSDDGQSLSLPDDPIYILIALVILGVVGGYAPGEIRRMQIEAAHRESMDGRLALAQGEFTAALAAFDRAIERAHSAYTRRTRVGAPAEWRLLPDGFYISLWRGRAAALMGMGRQRSAQATTRLADELEAALNGMA